MKEFILLSALLLIAFAARAQEKSTGIYKTSKDAATILDACIIEGKALKYGSADVNKEAGTATLWKYFAGGNDTKLQIFLTVTKADNGSTVKMVMPKLPNVFGSFEKEVKKYASQVKKSIPDLELVSISTGIE